MSRAHLEGNIWLGRCECEGGEDEDGEERGRHDGGWGDGLALTADLPPRAPPLPSRAIFAILPGERRAFLKIRSVPPFSAAGRAKQTFVRSCRRVKQGRLVWQKCGMGDGQYRTIIHSERKLTQPEG